jgi:hypothetical protein
MVSCLPVSSITRGKEINIIIHWYSTNKTLVHDGLSQLTTLWSILFIYLANKSHSLIPTDYPFILVILLVITLLPGITPCHKSTISKNRVIMKY